METCKMDLLSRFSMNIWVFKYYGDYHECKSLMNSVSHLTIEIWRKNERAYFNQLRAKRRKIFLVEGAFNRFILNTLLHENTYEEYDLSIRLYSFHSGSNQNIYEFLTNVPNVEKLSLDSIRFNQLTSKLYRKYLSFFKRNGFKHIYRQQGMSRFSNWDDDKVNKAFEVYGYNEYKYVPRRITDKYGSAILIGKDLHDYIAHPKPVLSITLNNKSLIRFITNLNPDIMSALDIETEEIKLLSISYQYVHKAFKWITELVQNLPRMKSVAFEYTKV